MMRNVVGTTIQTSLPSCFWLETIFFMKTPPIGFFRFPQNNLDSTPRRRKNDKILAKVLRSFIYPQIIAAATIDSLFLKALYLSLQMHISKVLSWRHLLG